MRYIISFVALVLTTFTAVAQSDSTAVETLQQVEVLDNNALWNSANQAYIDGDFLSAVKLYSAIENRGFYSARLYYNLGNAYFKSGELGKAILYYNRALVISPSMEDAKHNLEIAEAQTKDNISVVPEFFLNRWMRLLRSSITCTAWSVLSVVFFAMIAIFMLLFLLGTALQLRKVGFYGTVVALLLFVFTTTFAISARNSIINRSEAVVMSSAISVKSSPDRAATDIFVLHEGTKVTISTEVDGWCEVTIADGKKGWTESSHLERI